VNLLLKTGLNRLCEERFQVSGYRPAPLKLAEAGLQDSGCRMPDTGRRMPILLDTGYWILDIGY